MKNKNKQFFVGISLIFSIIMTIIVGSNLFCSYEDSYISISPHKGKSIFSEGDKIVIKNITVDGVEYKASDIFEGNEWNKTDNGALQWQVDGTQQKNNSLKALVPAGKNRKITFNADRWSGMVDFQLSNGRSYVKDLYSTAGSDVSISFNINGESLSINYVGYILCFIICFVTFYILVASMFLILSKNIDILQCFKQKNLFYKVMFLISGTILTTLMSLFSDSSWYIWATTCIGFISYFLIIFDYGLLEKAYQKRSVNFLIFSIFFSTYCSCYILINRITYLNNFFSNRFISYFIIVLVFPILVLISYNLFAGIINTARDFYKESDKYEKAYFVIFMIIACIAVLFIYSKTSGFSYGYYYDKDGKVGRQWADIIYGFDHSWILDSYTELSNHLYNIRHPLFRIFTIPAAFIASLIAVSINSIYPLAYPAILAIVNAFFMGVSAIILKRLLNERMAMIIFSVTYMFLILCLGSEQYQASLFFILSSVYACIKKKKSVYGPSGIMMSGTTLTSGFLVPFLTEFKSTKQYVIDLLRYCFIFAIATCVLGVTMSVAQISSLLNDFGGATYTFSEKIKVYTNFVEWCFISPSSQIVNSSTGRPIFTGTYPSTFSFIGCIILLICIVSFISYRKDKYAQICFISIIMSFVICAIIGWGMHEGWLYVILFSWAYISLAIMLINKAIKSRNIFNIIMIVLVIMLLVINISELKNLVEFCIKNYNALKV